MAVPCRCSPCDLDTSNFMDFFEEIKQAPTPIDFPMSPIHRFDITKPESPLIYSNYLWLFPEEQPSMENNDPELPPVYIELSERAIEKLESKSDSANDFAENLKISISNSFKFDLNDLNDESNEAHPSLEYNEETMNLFEEILPGSQQVDHKLKPLLSIDIPPSPMDMLPSANNVDSPASVQRDRNSSISSVATNISSILNSGHHFNIPSSTTALVPIEWDSISLISPLYKGYLLQICSETSYLVTDRFWSNLFELDFPFAQSKDAAFELWCAQMHCADLINKNCRLNGNLYSLLNHVNVRLLTSSNSKSQPGRDVLNALGVFRFFSHVVVSSDPWNIARLSFLPNNNDLSPVKEKNELTLFFELLVKVVHNSNMSTIYFTALYNESCHLFLTFLHNDIVELQDHCDLAFYNQLFYNALHYKPIAAAGILGTFFSSSTVNVDFSNKLSLFIFLLITQDNPSILHELNLDYNLLYNALVNIDKCPLLQTLLFFVIVHLPSFVGFLMSKSDPESYLLPILNVMYTNLMNKSNKITFYIPSILLFILTRDNLYTQQLQHVMVDAPDWLYTRMGNTSLLNIIHVSMTYLLVFNAGGLCDKYIQSNCLCVLYQLSTVMKQIHPYAAGKYISMMEAFYKNWLKQADPTLESIIQNGLEIINGCIATTIKQNIHLVYCIIHKQNLFESMAQHSEFELGNILQVGLKN